VRFFSAAGFETVFHMLADERRQAVARFSELLHALDAQRTRLLIAEVIDPAGREFDVDRIRSDFISGDAVLLAVAAVLRDLPDRRLASENFSRCSKPAQLTTACVVDPYSARCK
jgi:hypothetical protein